MSRTRGQVDYGDDFALRLQVGGHEPAQDALTHPGPPGEQHDPVIGEGRQRLLPAGGAGQVKTVAETCRGRVEQSRRPRDQRLEGRAAGGRLVKGDPLCFQVCPQHPQVNGAGLRSPFLDSIGEQPEHTRRVTTSAQQVCQPVLGSKNVPAVGLGVELPQEQRTGHPPRPGVHRRVVRSGRDLTAVTGQNSGHGLPEPIQALSHAGTSGTADDLKEPARAVVGASDDRHPLQVIQRG